MWHGRMLKEGMGLLAVSAIGHQSLPVSLSCYACVLEKWNLRRGEIVRFGPSPHRGHCWLCYYHN